VGRLGVRWFLALSSAVAAVALALTLRFPATTHYPVLGVVLLVVGFGTTSALFAATVAGTTDVSDDHQGVAAAYRFTLGAQREIIRMARTSTKSSVEYRRATGPDS
jgi:hypothetical protein